jgi:hypothetical protein
MAWEEEAGRGSQQAGWAGLSPLALLPQSPPQLSRPLLHPFRAKPLLGTGTQDLVHREGGVSKDKMEGQSV